MAAKSRVEKCYVKVSIHSQKSDFVYWQSQPYQVRLAALEQIRQEYHRWRYGAEPRLQRVYTIVKRYKRVATGRLQDLADLENLE